MNEYELLLTDIIEFHRQLEKSDDFVLSNGIRALALIESAVEAPFQTMFGKDLYPENIDKAAKLLYGLTKNHGFIDGNKRVAVHAMLTYLDVCGFNIFYEQEELVRLVENVAKATKSADDVHHDIVNWLKTRIVK